MSHDQRLPDKGTLGHGEQMAIPEQGRTLETFGDARREAMGDGRERWRLGPGRASEYARLLELGRAGVGGFVASGEDQAGPYLIRAAIETRLPALLGTHEDHPLAWRPVVVMAHGLAQALAAAERLDCFPGALRPTNVVLEPQLWIEAQVLVAAQLDANLRISPQAEIRREWLTPASADGRPEDHASNRWLLGLLVYRLLSGRGPFAGLGLRSAMDRLAHGVPPLPDALARELPPGLQSLLLRILAPEPSARPTSSADIARELAAFLAEGQPAEAPSTHSPPASPARAGISYTAAPASTSTTPAASPLRSTPATPTASPVQSPTAPAAPASSAAPTSSAAPAASSSAPARPRAKRGRRTQWGRVALTLATVIVGGLGGYALTHALSQDPAETVDTRPLRPDIGTLEPLDAAHTSPEDCASCHPRQSAEWKRSVMGHAAKSPLFQALEILIEEQVGRNDDCPGGAGFLRTADPRTACRDPQTGVQQTGSGGALWCANCHTPRENLGAVLPAWDGLASTSATRLPLRDLQPESTHEGIDCGFCHQVHGPVQPGNEARGLYEGNPNWINTATGRLFSMRPEDRQGLPGISNSGYFLDPSEFLVGAPGRPNAPTVPGGVHRRPSDEARTYLASSQFCGSCHDVRLFGADAIGTPQKGEHFRRLRNAYTEWANWSADEVRAGREAADCQDCHMSSFPGVCVAGEGAAPLPGETDITALRRGCPPGTHFESRAPGERPELRVAAGSGQRQAVTNHYFSGVDIPLTPAFDEHFIDQPELDATGTPLGGDQRRDLLLGRSFRFTLGEASLRGRTLELPIELENTGAGHKIPAGFSQEREFWVHLRVVDANDRVLYEVGRVDRGDEDLRDKIFVTVNTNDRIREQDGSPQGLFGADVVDGPDVQQWEALDGSGELSAATQFRGRGLINLQNGFLRCVQCIGFIDGGGRCQPVNAQQASHRAARFADAPFDNDTGLCQSNLRGPEALFETYFPVGALDATRGGTKGPDAIIDIRSAPPGVPMRWIYELPLVGAQGPLKIEARLLFRAFPPFLIKAFADYEARQSALGQRPSGPLVTREMLSKLEVVEIAKVERTLEL